MSDFDLSTYTKAPLRIHSSIEYDGSLEEGFDVVVGPEGLEKWCVGMKSCDVGENQENVQELALVGKVREEIPHFDRPHRAVYLDFPEIAGNMPQGWVGLIEVSEIDTRRCRVDYKVYWDKVVGGEHCEDFHNVIWPTVYKEMFTRLGKQNLLKNSQFEVHGVNL